jgi:hypothetical protein
MGNDGCRAYYPARQSRNRKDAKALRRKERQKEKIDFPSSLRLSAFASLRLRLCRPSLKDVVKKTTS